MPTELGWSFDEAEKSALELEALLRANGLEIESDSALEAAVLTSMHVAEQQRTRSVVSDHDDIRPPLRTMLGLHELARLILAVKDHRSFPSLLAHLKLLNKGAALQTTKSSGGDGATNKTFELMMACIAMACASDVELDHPESSKGNNPDVLATYGDQRWGIACKVLHGMNHEGFMENLKKGIDQIENSPAQKGVVVFNLKNVLPHDKLWLAERDESGMTFFAWPSVEKAQSVLAFEADEIARRLRSGIENIGDHLEAAFAGKKSIPAFLLWAHTAAGVMVNGKPITTSLRAFRCHPAGAIVAGDERVLNCLNWAAFHDSPFRGSKPTL